MSDIVEDKKHEIFDTIATVHGPACERLRGVIRDLHKGTCQNHVHTKVGEVWWSEMRSKLSYLIRRHNSATLVQGIWRARRRYRAAGGVTLRFLPARLRPEYKNAENKIREKITSLEPAGIDDDGAATGGGLHDWNNVIHCVPKIFAEGGEAFEYFLNESKTFLAFKEEASRAAQEQGVDGPAFKDLRLPPVKGSRALITGTLAKILFLNIESYNHYLLRHSSQTKTGEDGKTKEANRLVRTLLHGLRDMFVVAGIGHAGLYMVCFGDALVFVLNKLASRTTAYKVWTCALEAIELITIPAETGITRPTNSTRPGRRFKVEDEAGRFLYGWTKWEGQKPPRRDDYQNGWSRLHPRAEFLFKDRLLQSFPQWREPFEQWEQQTNRMSLVKAFMVCQYSISVVCCSPYPNFLTHYYSRHPKVHVRHPARVHNVVELANLSKAQAKAKIIDLRGKDCSDIVILENAPVNTDTTEGGIGALDYTLYRSLANFMTCFGVAQANSMMIFANDAGKLDKVIHIAYCFVHFSSSGINYSPYLGE